MTRLRENDIALISPTLSCYDHEQATLVGADYVRLAQLAAGMSEPLEPDPSPLVAIVPVTSGEGLLGGFSEAVRNILVCCGARPHITNGHDVTGLSEAVRSQPALVFIADDDTCIAFAPGCQAISDNSAATGKGFAMAMHRMIVADASQADASQADGSQAGASQAMSDDVPRILVLGAGPVGTAAACALSRMGYRLVVHDIDKSRGAALADACQAELADGPVSYRQFKNILDATNTGPFIGAEDLQDETNLVAPGIPLCVGKDAAAKARLYHNPLELGIATMYFDCLQQMSAAVEPHRPEKG
ncbi:MAG: hypothetical protein LBD25_04245 [Coriobacteriales bacterium]|jgi:pyrrolysine biosynthesis protein PylD|nr:hypothetical protein [Coriobacteriales bacterium]